MPGPLPDPKRRRRNAPTIPTTNLPIGGRTGAIPRPPKWVQLGAAGLGWWKWAWRTPQACAWGPGHEGTVARRATLEDDLAAVAAIEGLDLIEVLSAEDMAEVRCIVRSLAGLVSGRLAICREIRELDDRLGLTPKGFAALRFAYVAPPPVEDEQLEDEVSKRREDRRGRLAAEG